MLHTLPSLTHYKRFRSWKTCSSLPIIQPFVQFVSLKPLALRSVEPHKQQEWRFRRIECHCKIGLAYKAQYEMKPLISRSFLRTPSEIRLYIVLSIMYRTKGKTFWSEIVAIYPGFAFMLVSSGESCFNWIPNTARIHKIVNNKPMSWKPRLSFVLYTWHVTFKISTCRSSSLPNVEGELSRERLVGSLHACVGVGIPKFSP